MVKCEELVTQIKNSPVFNVGQILETFPSVQLAKKTLNLLYHQSSVICLFPKIMCLLHVFLRINQYKLHEASFAIVIPTIGNISQKRILKE